MIRATVLPPTATQLPGVGQASAVSASGVYSVVTAVNEEPPSLLRATAPVPTAGVPTQSVPTATQTRDDGQSMPKMSSTVGVCTRGGPGLPAVVALQERALGRDERAHRRRCRSPGQAGASRGTRRTLQEPGAGGHLGGGPRRTRRRCSIAMAP